MKPLPQYLTVQTAHSVCEYIRTIAQDGRYKVSFKPVSQRTLDQNNKIQAMCTDISRQVVLDTVKGGYKLKSDCEYYKQFDHNAWRHILIAGFTKSEIVPGIEPGQAVCLYPSTTDLGLQTGGDFITYIYAYGNDMNVEWTEPEQQRGNDEIR